MLKLIFDFILIMLALLFTMCFSMLHTMFLLTDHEKLWVTAIYFFIFIGGVFGIKSLGRYYVRNFL